MPPKRRETPRRPSPSLLVLAIAAAVGITASLVAVSVLGSRGSSSASQPAPATAAPVTLDPLFRGIPQDGIALGRPDAPVTLVEYADLQCPYCAQWSQEALPAIVTDYVRTGRVRIVFRGLAFLGPDSVKALRATLAAGEQDRLWDALHALFARQGAENAGWVTDDLLSSLKPLGVDVDRMFAPWVERQLGDAARLAKAAGVPGTPYFQIGRAGGPLRPLEVPSLDAATITAELDRQLAA